MKFNFTQIALASLSFGSLIGCSNIGNAPAGASVDQLKSEEAQEPPLQQIRNLEYSPTPPAQKEQQIKAIEDKYHVSRDDANKNLPPVKFSNTPPPELPTGKK
jgi:hypothetical protein